MAERRMMAIRVIDDDAFLDLPMGARLLYYDLTMRADDDGFITPKKVMRLIGASQKDLDSLINAGFLIAFDSGVVAITHWRQSNALRKDRYTPTAYQEEFSLLQVNNGIYEKYSGCQTVAKVSSQDKEHGNQMATKRQPTRQQTAVFRRSTPSEAPTGGILPRSVPQIHLRCRAVRCRKHPVPSPSACRIRRTSSDWRMASSPSPPYS